MNAGLSIKDGRSFIAEEVSGHEVLVSVAKDPLESALTCLLDLHADLFVACLLLQPDGEVHHRHIGGGHAEGHAGQLAVELGDDFADSLGGPGRAGDDVLGGAAPSSPVLAAGAVYSLLGGGGGVHSGHQTLYTEK